MKIPDESQIKFLTGNEVNNTSNNSDLDKPSGLINIQPILRKYLRIRNQLVKEFIAEILGTLILLLIGLSSVAQFKFFTKNETPTNIFSINIAFGFGAILAILVTGKTSGAHLNPAVSFSMLLTGRMTFLRFIVYCLGQLIGAFLAAVLTFIVYYDQLKYYGIYTNTADIFATYPNPNLSTFGGFLDQLIGTAVLIIVVLALSDKKNTDIPQGTSAILVGCLVIVIGCSLGFNCGYAINPARDFGPRLFTYFAGWGVDVFKAGNYFFWIPIIAPMVGSFVATVLYTVLISIHL